MDTRAYLSNISPVWPLARQEALFDERLPGWRKLSVFRDELGSIERIAHRSATLRNRESLLRVNERLTRYTVVVASLPCFGWKGYDFRNAFEAFTACNASLLALDVGQTFGHEDLSAALKAFGAGLARAKSANTPARGSGGSAAAAVMRKAATDVGVERIRHLWPLPADEWPTYILRLIASDTDEPKAYNTLVDRLGGREQIQAQHAREVADQSRCA